MRSSSNTIRRLYRTVVPAGVRHVIYKLRKPGHFRQLRSVVYPSPRGDFSLRPFDQHRCIFVHIPKTAGVSVALSLFGYMPYHYTALDYRLIYGARTFSRYFKFAFVRNPWDRLFSAYRFLRAGGWNDADRTWMEENIAHFESFSEFVECWLTPETSLTVIHFRPQWQFVCDQRRHLLLDHLGYLETIEQDFRFVSRRLGVDASLQRRNTSPRKKNYRGEYSDRAREIVRDVYQRDIELFGYGFERIEKRRVIA